MALRTKDWLRQAEADLGHARHSRDAADFDWACFACQQSAEKAAKAVHESLSSQAWGHSVTALLDALMSDVLAIDEALLDRARRLDKHYIPARYPYGLPAGAPADYYTRAEANQAIQDAEVILDVCRRALQP